MPSKHILIVDDVMKNIQLLGSVLRNENYQISFATSGQQALDSVEKDQPVLILLDINMPEMDGFEVCRRLKSSVEHKDIPVIFLTANSDIDTITQGFQLGAADYITKPFNAPELLSRVKTQLSIHLLLEQHKQQNAELILQAQVAKDMLKETRKRQDGPLLGNSPAIQTLREQIHQASQNTESVLLIAWPGSGAELVARTIHNDSTNQDHPFIYINCSQITQSNATAIINHDENDQRPTKLDLAVEGTLFLDRVNDMPLEIQEEFCRHMLEISAHHTRIICLATEDLEQLAHQKKFNERFLAFISHQNIIIPPLKDRIEDIPILCEHYMHHYASRHGKNINAIDQGSLQILQNYKWPGNISELMNIIESQVVICNNSTLHIPESVLNKGIDIGGYKLIRQLDAGGMGEVWLAEHSLLGRPAAIKLIQADGLSLEEAQMRFFHEAKAISQLRSPHTIKLYDFGIRNNGSFYYVMELLKGLDLSMLLELTGALEPRRVIYILKQCCFSLVEAHKHGLIHRDIKPGNIFICQMDYEHDFVKVLDFGIAKDLKSDDLELTGNRVVGTPAYLAPETFLDKNSVDHTIDIYALACVAYQMLANKCLFQSDSVVGYFAEHLNSEPPAIREFAQNDEIPIELEELLLKCLAKQPEERPNSEELLDQLLRIEEKHPWKYQDAKDWWYGREF